MVIDPTPQLLDSMEDAASQLGFVIIGLLDLRSIHAGQVEGQTSESPVGGKGHHLGPRAAVPGPTMQEDDRAANARTSLTVEQPLISSGPV